VVFTTKHQTNALSFFQEKGIKARAQRISNTLAVD